MFAQDQTGETIKEVRADCTPKAVHSFVLHLGFDGYWIDWEHSTINKTEGL